LIVIEDHGQEYNGSISSEEEERTTCVSIEEYLEKSREQTLESEIDTFCKCSCSSIHLEDIEEKINLKRKLI